MIHVKHLIAFLFDSRETFMCSFRAWLFDGIEFVSRETMPVLTLSMS
jgi:hypothetical protein